MKQICLYSDLLSPGENIRQLSILGIENIISVSTVPTAGKWLTGGWTDAG